MIRRPFLLGLTLLALCALCVRAQDATVPPPKPEVVLTKLGPITYPRIARTARINGDVVVELEIAPDGTVQSSNPISGPRLLYRSALESAQQSQFECRGCGDKAGRYHLVYSFKLVGEDACCAALADASKTAVGDEPFPRISRMGNHVTVADQVVCICDPPAILGKRRSWKCLYLWHCTR